MIRILLVAALLCLTACSTPSGVTAPGLGHRIGTVVQVGDAAAFGPLRDNDCRHSADPDAPATQRYASVQYFSGRHAHLRIVPIADDFDASEGDQVVVKTIGCKDALSRERDAIAP